MSEEKRQWPDHIVDGPIRYGKAKNYDGFYLADAMHGIPTFGSVTDTEDLTIHARSIGGQFVRVFNYPGQTEEIAKQLVLRWNAFPAMKAALEEAQSALAVLTEPKHIGSTSVHNAWAMAVAAEQKVRAALSLAKGEE